MTKEKFLKAAVKMPIHIAIAIAGRLFQGAELEEVVKIIRG